jgi:alpha-L-fucosidase
VAAPGVDRVRAFRTEYLHDYYGTDLVLPATINVLDLRENIEAGQQVSEFAVDALIDGFWTEIASGTTIGHRRLLTLPAPIAPADVRVRILSSRAEVAVSLTVHFDPLLVRSGQADE